MAHASNTADGTRLDATQRPLPGAAGRFMARVRRNLVDSGRNPVTTLLGFALAWGFFFLILVAMPQPAGLSAAGKACLAVVAWACIVWVSATFYIFFKVCDAVLGNRVSPETELAGLDIPEMGLLGYPDFVLSSKEKVRAA